MAGSWPDVTAFPLDEALAVLDRAGAKTTVLNQPGGQGPGPGEWRVVRQRALGEREVELLAAWRAAGTRPEVGGQKT